MRSIHKIEGLYLNNPKFKTLVDSMYAMVKDGHFTMRELNDAIVFVRVLVEMYEINEKGGKNEV